MLSSHPDRKALVPLIGLETGSVRLARQIMPSRRGGLNAAQPP